MLRKLALGVLLAATLLQALGLWLYRRCSGVDAGPSGGLRRRVRMC